MTGTKFSGLRVHVEENRALPLMTLAVSVCRGSTDDPKDKEGVTRVMGRMLRRGCRGMDSQAVEEKIDALGADLIIDVSPSIVTIHADVISRNVDPFIELLARLIAEPTFDEAELGKLLREIQGEIIDARDNDRALASRHFRRRLFEGHPYGRRMGGSLATVASITRADVVEQYRRAFTRGNLALAFAGDIDEERANALAERLASGVSPGNRNADTPPAPPRRRGRSLVFVDKPERTQTQILMGTVGSHPRDADHIPLHVATTVLGGTFTSRLMREIRSRRGWSYGAYARLSYDRQPDAFTVWTFPSAKDSAAAIELELEMLETWRRQGISPEELEFAKRYLVRSHAFDIDTAQKRVHQRLDIELFDLPADHHTHYIDHVNAVTCESANAAIRDHISTDDLVVSVVGTHEEIGNDVAKAIPGLDQSEVVSYDAD